MGIFNHPDVFVPFSQSDNVKPVSFVLGNMWLLYVKDVVSRGQWGITLPMKSEPFPRYFRTTLVPQTNQQMVPQCNLIFNFDQLLSSIAASQQDTFGKFRRKELNFPGNCF